MRFVLGGLGNIWGISGDSSGTQLPFQNQLGKIKFIKDLDSSVQTFEV